MAKQLYEKNTAQWQWLEEKGGGKTGLKSAKSRIWLIKSSVYIFSRLHLVSNFKVWSGCGMKWIRQRCMIVSSWWIVVDVVVVVLAGAMFWKFIENTPPLQHHYCATTLFTDPNSANQNHWRQRLDCLLHFQAKTREVFPSQNIHKTLIFYRKKSPVLQRARVRGTCLPYVERQLLFEFKTRPHRQRYRTYSVLWSTICSDWMTRLLSTAWQERIKI